MHPVLKNAATQIFKALDRLGLHVLPKSYYTPVADRHWLSSNHAAWAKRASLVGINWSPDEHLNWLREICTPYYKEVKGLHSYDEIIKSQVGPGYGPIESQILHCFIRAKKPSRIVEIGSGASTAVMLKAIEINAQEGTSRSELTCIEPYPKPAFRSIAGIKHIEQVCQSAPFEVFQSLESGDFLFIDSSHALKTGSDLSTIYLEILPRTRPGVTIHIHDIFLPYLYSPAVLDHYFDWQETAFVLALLTHNPHFAIQCGLAGLQTDRTQEIQNILSDFQARPLKDGLFIPGASSGHYVSSLWLTTK